MEGVHYPLTHAQKRIWYTEKIFPGTSISNLSGVVKLKTETDFDVTIFKAAIRHFIRLNDSMRLHLRPEEANEPRQYISTYKDFHIQSFNFSSQEEAFVRVQEEARKPLRLYNSDLFDFSLFNINGCEIWMFVKVHHVIADGISMVILVNQIIDLYLELVNGTGIRQDNDLSYLEHVRSELEYEKSQRFWKDQAFWNDKFSSLPELTSIVRSDFSEICTEANRFSKVIPESLQKDIKLFCKENSISELSLFLSILYIYLHRATGQEDIVAGTFMANRTNAREKQMIGMFVSTIPIRSLVDETMEFISFVRLRMKDLMAVIRHQKYPYNLLVNDLREKHGSVSKLFGITLEYQIMQWQQKGNVTFLTDPMFSGHEGNDISIHVKERWDTGALTMDFDYRTELFTEDEIENIFRGMMTLLEDALVHPDKKLCDLKICSDEEKQILIKDSSQELSYPRNMTLNKLFEQQALKIPEQTAIVFQEGISCTYKELNERSNRLGHVLRAKGVGPDIPVAIWMDRSIEFVTSILGVLKAGGAYVPIDPDLPESRIRFMLQDAAVKVILTEKKHLERFDPEITAIIVDEELLCKGVSENLLLNTGSQNLAYIIYTSGTTGKPKGVMIEHRQVSHLIESLNRQVYSAYKSVLNVALVAPFHFDASVQQIFTSLLFGHTLFIAPRSALSSGKAFAEYYRVHPIDITDGTPIHLQMLIAAGNLEGVNIRHMLIGGEALPYDTVKRLFCLFKRNGKSPIITNVYGPTECCVDASAYDIGEMNHTYGTPNVPIGKPLGNNRLYVLDNQGRMVPAGIQGELHIAGEGVGRGYLNLPELTAARFLADPFVPGKLMYRTGDLAMRRPDGNIQFLGRRDDQVKIRGYRIELGEIEAVLNKSTDIQKAVVLAHPGKKSGMELCAYLVLKDKDNTIFHLRDRLSKELPAYMVPSYFVKLDELPVTASGKLDRKALLELDVTANMGREYEAPSNELESKLAKIWQEVLRIERVGRNDHFFELGGHSLKAMELLFRIHKECGAEVPLQVLFEMPTLSKLAAYIPVAKQTDFVSIQPADVRESYPISSAQQRVFIASQFEDRGIGYNMPGAVLLEGNINSRRLERAFFELIHRHEALRTSFHTVDGLPVQKVHSEVSFFIEEKEPGIKSAESAIESFIRPFDLSQAPLMRVELIPLEENEKSMMLIDMHHLISDGVSIGIILNDLGRFYGGESIPELRIQYKDFSVWQKQQNSHENSKEEIYWTEAFRGELPLLQMLTDFPRPVIQSFEGDRVSVVLEKELRDKLKGLADTTGTTLYMVMLAAYHILLSKYTGQEDIIIGTPAAGRNHADLDTIVGMFVNTLAIRTKSDRESVFIDFLQGIRHEVLGAVDNQNYPFETLIEKLNVPRDVSRNPLFDTMFILQNSFSGIPDIGDIRLSIHDTNFHIAKFDLTLQATEEGDVISVDLDYSTKLFHNETVMRMLRHYKYLLEMITSSPGTKLGQYNLLTDDEENQLLTMFNPEATQYPREASIVQLFEEQAEKAPDSTALAFEGTELTYRELNERANQLAGTLRSRGVHSGTFVALLLNKSIEMVTGVLAILKAGGAYVPIDPENPVGRIEYFLSDCGADVLLTLRSLAPIFDDIQFSGQMLYVDDDNIYDGDISTKLAQIRPDQIANLTYTSGTTGKPKGNMVTHANIIRTVKKTNYIDIRGDDVFLCLSNYVFDAFMFDMFGALLNGAKLVLAHKETVLDLSKLVQVIEKERITVMMITTALFNLLMDVHPNSIRGIRKVLFGGERASIEHVRKALESTGKGKLLHMYGPSETTVFATFYPVDEIEVNAAALPIGKPVSNTEVYILDSLKKPQPIGVAGELYVGGDGLVLGYMNRPSLTAEKFIPSPFKKEGKIYRTGDLARWLPDGNIEFIGRMDHQVKIRGQRIELGEIEHVFLAYESIQEAVVLAIDTASGEKILCAYIVESLPLSDSELRELAAKGLPPYMVPSVFIRMEKLPLTRNGKVNRRALPLPETFATFVEEYIAPRNAVEISLAVIWQNVLGMDRVGMRDNFFEIGGHSLKAMTMLARIRQELNAEVALRDLFQAPTIEALGKRIENTRPKLFSSIKRADARGVYPVSSAQRRMFVLHQLERAQQSYNMPSVMRLYGSLDVERFNKAISKLILRHETLRTSFKTEKGEPVQCIHEAVNFSVSYRESVEDEADRIIEDFIRPFALNEVPLLRIELVRISQDNYFLMFDMHHIISDGISVSVMIDEITKLYANETLEPLEIQYKDYAVWQQAFFESEAYKEQETYWLEQFSGELPVLNLPLDHSRPAVQSFEGDRTDFILDPELTLALNNLVHKTDTTLYMVLMAAYSAWLAKLSGQVDIVVGSPISGRTQPEVENIVGMFVNTLAIRTYPQGEKTFSEYLEEVKQTALGAYECQDYPFEDLVGKVQAQRDTSRNPLFDAMFVLQNMEMRELKMEGTRLEPYKFDYKIAKFDLSLSVKEEEGRMACSLEYNTALFEPETIERWTRLFMELLKNITKNADVMLSEIHMLTQEEQQVLIGFNDTKTIYPGDKTIHELFEEQAESMPESIAVVFGEDLVTYRELNERANRLARTLQSRGLQAEKAVGIMVEPSIDMVAGILAILKAGGAYVPIDPEYPTERLQYLMDDSGTEMVLTQQKFEGHIQDKDLIFLDDPIQLPFESGNLQPLNSCHDLAYIMYTSGSTGRPKGVMVEHQNVVSLVKNAGYVPFGETSRMAQTGSISFDASTFEIFGALLNGGTLYPVPKSILLDAVRLSAFLKEHQITTMWLTSPLFNQLAQENAEMFSSLHHLIIGGDVLVPRYVNVVRKVCPEISLWNGYGPTENTTFSTCFLIKKDFNEQIPIGKPISNSTAYILNSNHHLQPIGIPGELYVGGDGVARGYFHRPLLTSEKFMTSPFATGERMYRTGDLARWLPDGTIEFLGRIDHQVKIRGFRIELGEVESQLLAVDNVFDAVVTTRQNESGQSLCAYFTGPSKLSSSELRMKLSRSLPAYMIPAYFVHLDSIPLTKNGKVDRKALPEPDGTFERELEYKKPRNEREELLCLVWQEVLGTKQIGISDNFFSRGGDSIKAIQISARLHKYGWKLDMKNLFQNPTIELVSCYLEQIHGGQAEQSPVEGIVPLTPIQKWFFTKQFTDMHHWNQAVMLHAPSGFDPHFVERTLQKMVRHHDALRMEFSIEDGQFVQFNSGLDAALPELDIIRPDVSDNELEKAILLETNRIQGSINLSKGSLLKAALFQTSQGDHLLIVIHHLVVDGVSWRILIEDFAAGYHQAEKGEEIILPEKTHSYQKWAEKLQEYANSKTFLKEIDYWSLAENGNIPSLPRDIHESNSRMRHVDSIDFSLSSMETVLLTTQVHEAYHTEINDILLTALGYAIQEWTGQKQVLVNLEGHGREEVIEELNVSRTVGWFTTQYPVVLDMQNSSDIDYQIKRVKEDLRHIPNKGIGYGLLRYLTDEEHKTDLLFPLAPEIGFNYLGEFKEQDGNGLFKRSALSIGNSLSPETEKMHPIDISGAIEGDVLKMTIFYSSLDFEKQTIRQLGETFKRKLILLMEHCLNQSESILTPSDMGDDELTLEELEKLMEIL